MFDEKEMRYDVYLKGGINVVEVEVGGLFFGVEDPAGEESGVYVRIFWKDFRKGVGCI